MTARDSLHSMDGAKLHFLNSKAAREHHVIMALWEDIRTAKNLVVLTSLVRRQRGNHAPRMDTADGGTSLNQAAKKLKVDGTAGPSTRAAAGDSRLQHSRWSG